MSVYQLAVLAVGVQMLAPLVVFMWLDRLNRRDQVGLYIKLLQKGLERREQ